MTKKTTKMNKVRCLICFYLENLLNVTTPHPLEAVLRVLMWWVVGTKPTLQIANKTIEMSKIRQIQRLFTQSKSNVQISDQTEFSHNTVKKNIRKYILEKMTYDTLSNMADAELEALFVCVGWVLFSVYTGHWKPCIFSNAKMKKTIAGMPMKHLGYFITKKTTPFFNNIRESSGNHRK